MVILALDIGGTNLKYASFSEDLKQLSAGEVPSNAALGAQKLLQTVFSVCDGQTFDIIGVSTAGMVAPDGSIAYANQNIPDYTGVKLSEILSERYGVKAFVLNDIAAGAIAETVTRSGDFYYLALGTGVGGIMISGGLPCQGECGIAGQIGYLPALNGGIIDKSASTSALTAQCGIGGARGVFERAERGDGAARAVLSAWAKQVMHVISLIIGFYNPPAIVIGGGVSRQGKTLIKYLLNEQNVLPEPYRGKVELTTASNPSGVKGAAQYAITKLKK